MNSINLIRVCFLTITLFLIGFSTSTAQLSKAYKKLSKAEKCWVILHPFKAKRAYIISKEVNVVVDSILKTKTMGTHVVGNQLDAFKHTLWMWSLSKKIGWRAAKSLGDKHEKGNYQFYLKHKLEDGALPDSISCLMDIKNNRVGIMLYKKYKQHKLSKQDRIRIVKETVFKGETIMVFQTVLGVYLDKKGNTIPKENYIGFWNNSKCLVPSSSQFLMTDNKSKSLNLR